MDARCPSPSLTAMVAGPSQGGSAFDVDLIRAARRGDAAASRRVFDHLRELVTGQVVRMLGRSRREGNEDIVQDILLKIFRALPRFDPSRGARFTTWCFAIAANHCRDVLRKRTPPTISLTDAVDAAVLPGDESQGPVDQAERRELAAVVRGALDDLAPHHRAVLALREEDGLPYADIAARVGENVGTVKSRLYRAKTALRVLLEPAGLAGVRA